MHTSSPKAALLLLAAVLVAGPSPAGGQGPERVAATRFAAADLPDHDLDGSELYDFGPFGPARPAVDPPAAGIGEMTLAGLFTGAAGGLVGAVLVGPVVHGVRCRASGGCTAGDLGALESLGYGMMIGAALGPAVGVHAANGRRGSFGLDLLAGGAVAAIAVTLASADSGSPAPIAISLLGGSLVSAVVERQTSR